MAAAPSYDQFASNVRATYPALDEEAIKSAYSSQFGKDAVRTSGPSLADFSANVRKTYPDLPDDHIKSAYDEAYGTSFLTALKRSAVSGYGSLLAPLGEGITKIGSTFGSPKLVDAGKRVSEFWGDKVQENAPALADQPMSLTHANTYAQVLGGLGGYLGGLGPVLGPGEAASRVYDKTGSAGKAATVGGLDVLANFIAPEAGLGRLATAGTFAGAGALEPAVESKAIDPNAPLPWKQMGLNALGGGAFGLAVPGRVVGAGSRLWGPQEYADAMAASAPPTGGISGRPVPSGPLLTGPPAEFMARAREVAGVEPGADLAQLPPDAAPTPPPAPIMGADAAPTPPEPPPPATPPPVNLAPDQLAASQAGLSQDVGSEILRRSAGIGADLPPRTLALPAPAPSGEFVGTPAGNVIQLTQAQSASNAATRAATNARLDSMGMGEAARIAQRMLENRRANPPAEAGIVNPIDPSAPHEVKLQQLAALTEQNKPLVQSTIQAISQALPGTHSEDSVKAPETMLEKINRPETKVAKPWMQLEHIRDSYRFRTSIDSGAQLEQLPDILAKQGFQVVKVDTGKFFHGNPWGWRMAALDLRAPNGQIIEWYTTFKPILDYSNGEGHAVYEKWRNVDPATLSAEDRSQFEADRIKSQEANRKLFDQSVEKSGQNPQALSDSLTTFARKAGLMTRIQPSRLPRTPSLEARSLQPPAPDLMRQGAPPPGSTITAPSASLARTSGAVSTAPSIPSRPTHGPNELIAPGGRKVAVQPALVELSDLIHSQRPNYDAALPKRAYEGKSVQSADGQTSFDFGDIETRPDTLPRQLGAAHGALTELLNYRDRGGQVSVLANRLTQDFTRTGSTTLVGQKIGSASDLAAIAQVYRDPRFETLRFITVDKDGRILSHFGHTSRLPGTVNFSIDIAELGRVLNVDKSAGFYMLHNHPLGSAKPSLADINATRSVAEHFPWLKGHVVIDHDEHTVIQPSGDYRTIKRKFGGYDPNVNPKVPHALLDTKITKMEQLPALGAALQARAGFVTLIAMTDDAKVGAIAEYPTKLLTQGLTTAARIRTLQRQSGSGNYVFAVGAPEDLNQIEPLVLRGLVSATVVRVGRIAHVGKIYGRPNVLNDRRKSYLTVGQAQTPLEGEAGPFEPGAENEIGGGTYKLRQFANLEPEELRVLAGVVENLDGPVASHRRGARTWDATEEAALKMIREKYGFTLDSLVNRKKGSAANAEQLEAYAQLISATSKAIRRLADEVVATGSHESKIALAAARDKLGMLLAPALGYQTEAGRALNILRKTAAANQEASRILDALGDGSDASLSEFARRIKSVGSIDQVIGLTRVVYTPSLWDKFYEAWISGLLSGPTTHAVNMVSNAAFQVLDLAGDTAGTLLSGDQHLRSVAAKVVGMVHGIPVGIKNAAAAFKTEEAQIGSHLQTQHGHRAIGGITGKVVRVPLRALVAEDEFFKAIAYHGELARMAMDQAIGEKPPNVRDRFHEILGAIQNDPDMMDAAMKAAERATFQTDLGPTGKALQHLLEKSKVGKLIIPFVRTPTNIIMQALEFTPAAPSFKAVRDALSHGGRDGALAWSRMAIGSAIMLGMVFLAMKGQVSGNGPNDPEERALLMRQGWQPYSIKVGGKWYKYNRIDPIGTLLGVAADMHDIVGYAKPGELEKMGTAVITSLALNLGDKTFLRGITDFSQAYADPQRYLERWAQGMAGSLVPNASAQVARGLDPFMRQTDTMLDAIKAKIPGLRQTLTKKLDIAGDPIPQVGDFPGNPFPGQAQNQDRLADAMLRLSVNKGKPAKSITYLTRTVNLTPEEYQDYASQVQQARWKVLTPMVSSPQFQQAMRQAPDLAAKLLGDQWDSIGDAMKTRYLYTHQEVIRRLAEPKAPRSGSPYAQEAQVP